MRNKDTKFRIKNFLEDSHVILKELSIIREKFRELEIPYLSWCCALGIVLCEETKAMKMNKEEAMTFFENLFVAILDEQYFDLEQESKEFL